MDDKCPVCGCDKCICEDGCDSCGAQMVEIKGTEFTDIAQSTDVKDKDKKFQMPKAYGDKYVKKFANLIIGKNPYVRIGRALATEYGDDVIKLGKKYKIQSISYDRWNASMLVSSLIDDYGINAKWRLD